MKTKHPDKLSPYKLMWWSGKAVLLSGMVLMACSPAPEPAKPGEADPYAGGVTYAWTDVSSAPATVKADTDLSDAVWTSASNIWGPVEKDKSNGDQAAGDGKPLTIGGQTYTTGLGVHANSEVIYSLSGTCTTFSASVGIDNEVGSKGSVNFQVYNADKLLSESGIMRGGEAAKQLTADLSGVQKLRLVVTNGDGTINDDHADWGDAKIGCKPVSGTTQLSDLAWTTAISGWGPIERDMSNGDQGALDGKPLTIGGQVFAKGLGVHANSEVIYSLSGPCTTFSASVGIDNEVGSKGSVNFQVYNADTLLSESGIMRGGEAAKQLTADLSGVQKLRLVVTDGGDDINDDHANWGDAKVTCTPELVVPPLPKPFGRALEYQGIANQPYSAAEAQGIGLGGQVYVFGGFDTTRNPIYTPNDRAYRYDPAQNTWNTLAKMPKGGVTHAGMATDGTFIYYAGGYTSNNGSGQIFGTKAAYRYDPASDSYTSLPDLPAESGAGQLAFLDGKLHHFGGLSYPNKDKDVPLHYVLDLVAGAKAWTLAAPMPQPRNHFGSAVLNGKIYAIGGQTGDDAKLTTHADMWAYDPATDAWTAVKAMPAPYGRGHISNSTFVMNGRIVVVGGETTFLNYIGNVITYDPVTDAWTALSNLPEARSSGVGAALDNEHLVFTGGNNTNIQPQASGWKATLR
jgi:N-acetylneuraminic acid mutarotase